MENEISPILAVNNTKLKPYIEIFQYHPENITQQPLGILVGFFEIREYSEDSAYVVNFLNSVLKKEYYINSKRSVQESFDCALHKINIALSELVKHGNVNWLGKLDAAICVLDKNSIHFSITGKAKILLARKLSLTNIAEDLAPDMIEPHPLKTFVNVSSGRIEKNDKLIIASDDLFQIFSITDLEKNIERFDNEKFIQFIKTAMTNELDLAGTIIIDVKEPEKIIRTKNKLSQVTPEKLNAFSGKSFTKKKTQPETTPMAEKTTGSTSLDTNSSVLEKEYTDKKTGHIYIQGDNENEDNRDNPFNEKLQIIKELFYDASYGIKQFLKRQAVFGWKKTKKEIANLFSYDYACKLSVLTSSLTKKYQAYLQAKKEKTSIQEKEPLIFTEKTSFSQNIFFSWFSRLHKVTARMNFSFFNRSFPDFSKIKNLFFILTNRQKIVALSIVLLVVIFPLIFSKIIFRKETPDSHNEISAPEISSSEKYSQEKNIVFIRQTEKIKDIPNIVSAIPLDDSLYVITENKILALKGSEKTEFVWPEEYGTARLTTYMRDLNLIFILTDSKKIISFSPISREIKDNAIEIPIDVEINSVSTYLTYLYITDTKNGQIYRYPRAEGGFGGKLSWLKETTDLSASNNMAIDENVYLTMEDKLKKYFRGKDTGVSFENSQTPINFDRVVTDITMNNVYVLDNANGRIIQFDKKGILLKQYHNEILTGTKNFSIDEKNAKAYLILADGLDALRLE